MALTICLAVGCKRRSGAERDALEGNTSGVFFSRKKLEATLTNGLTKEAILAAYGQPIDERVLEGGIVCLTFDTLRGDTIVDSDSLVGFQVLIVSNSLVRWSPTLTANEKLKDNTR